VAVMVAVAAADTAVAVVVAAAEVAGKAVIDLPTVCRRRVAEPVGSPAGPPPNILPCLSHAFARYRSEQPNYVSSHIVCATTNRLNDRGER
jgi:hypothetical protein